MMFYNDDANRLWLGIAKAVHEKDGEKILALGRKMPKWGNMVSNKDIAGLLNHEDPRAQEFAVLGFWSEIPNPDREKLSNNARVSLRSAAAISRITILLRNRAQKQCHKKISAFFVMHPPFLTLLT